MGISGIPAIPMIITCLLQGILCDTGIPRTFYGGKICSVVPPQERGQKQTFFTPSPSSSCPRIY